MESFMYFIGGIISAIIVGFVYYRLGIKGAYPTYLQKSIKLLGIENSLIPSEIEMLFKGQSIKRLIKTYVLIWNNGRKTIDGKDIANNLRINLEHDANILSAQVTKVTKHANRVTVDNVGGHVISFSFEYLDPKDGVLIEILHQSKLEEIIFIDGDIKGVPNGIRPFKRNMVLKFMAKIILLIVLFLLIIGPYVPPILELSIIAVSLATMLILFLYDSYRPYPKALKDKSIEF